MIDMQRYENNEQMEYLRKKNEEKKQQIARRKERYRVLLEKARNLLKLKSR